MRYKAFVSYKHVEESRRHSIAIERAIKRHGKPIFELPRRIFRDEKDLSPGNDLQLMIKMALEKSDYLIFLASKDSANSIWCQEELRYWCNELERANNLIIIHLADTIEVDVKNNCVNWNITNAIPVCLRDYLQGIPFYIDFKGILDEYQMNLRYPDYKLKINQIVARIEGVSPEDMLDEDLRAYRKNVRRKRLLNSALGLIFFSLLLNFIFINSTRHQKEIIETSVIQISEYEEMKTELESLYHECLAENEELQRRLYE